MRAQHVAALDGMRAVAMLSVFAFHYGLPEPKVLDWGVFGYRVVAQLDLGVEIFFVLSGLLVFRPFAAAALGDAGAPRLWEYAVRRAARIYPAYWLAFGVLLALGEIQMHGGVLHFGAHLALVQGYFTSATNDAWDGIQQAWTLVVEVSFYVMVPLIFVLLRGRSLRIHLSVLAALTTVGYVLRITTASGPYGGAIGRAIGLLPLALAALAPGMALAVLDVARPEALHALARRRWVWWAIAASAFAALVWFGAPPRYTAWRTETGPELWHRMLSPVIAVCLVVPAAFGRPPGHERRGLAHPIMVWLGTVSYGAYLWHQSLLLVTPGDTVRLDPYAMRDWSLGAVLLAGAGILALSLAIAAVSWYALERPVQQLARRFARRH